MVDDRSCHISAHERREGVYYHKEQDYKQKDLVFSYVRENSLNGGAYLFGLSAHTARTGTSASAGTSAARTASEAIAL
jgi:hypothetical protein